MQLLETRLDTVVYKAGFAQTQNQARQFVNHGHVMVNDKKVTIPSFQVVPGMKVSIDAKLQQMIDDQRGFTPELPVWVAVGKNSAEVLALPTREQMPSIINEQLIVEFYSR